MHRITISRNGQTYGPYTLEDLGRYVASGHILLSDLARADDSTDWVPVSQFLPNVPSPAQPIAPGTYAPPLYSTAALNSPPNLHWALVLLFDLLTCSFFQIIWNLVISSWFRKVSPASRALPLYIAATVLLIVQFVTGQIAGIARTMHGFGPYTVSTTRTVWFHGGAFALYAVIALACWVVRLLARFTFRAELERHYNTVEPLGLSVNPVLTFFFGGIYLQSVMNEINGRRRLLAYPVPNPYPPR